MINRVDSRCETIEKSGIRNTILVQKNTHLGTRDVLGIEEIIGNALIVNTYALDADLEGLAGVLRRYPKYDHSILVIQSKDPLGSIAPVAALMRKAHMPYDLVAVSGGWEETSGRYNHVVDHVYPHISKNH